MKPRDRGATFGRAYRTRQHTVRLRKLTGIYQTIAHVNFSFTETFRSIGRQLRPMFRAVGVAAAAWKNLTPEQRQRIHDR